MNTLLLLQLALASVPVTLSQDFKTLCQGLTGTSVKSFYLRSRCYVLDTAKKGFFDVVCHHLKPAGHLALLPGFLLVAKAFENFQTHMTFGYDADYPWIGIKRNQSVPSSSRDFHFWLSPNQPVYAPAVVTDWRSTEPDPGMSVGLLWDDKIGDNVLPLGSVGRGYVCEYHDHQCQFKGVLRGVRGTALVTVEQMTLLNPMADCPSKCKRNAICHSFTVSQATGLCALHMLPTQDLLTETLSDGIVFDIID